MHARSYLLVACAALALPATAAAQQTDTPLPGLRLELRRAPAGSQSLTAVPQAPADTQPVRFGVSSPEWQGLPCPDCEPRRKYFKAAAGELFVTWLVPWSVNYYIRDAQFAHISLNSWWDNITGTWTWDDNTFQTNQFAHPLHGAFYFHAFRANGYNFWQSSLGAGFGAFGWECCGETHPIAVNDLVNTTLGGIALGEMLYRLSTLALDNSATGSERTWRELGGFLMSPWNGFSRFVRGQSNDIAANPPSWRPAFVQGSLDIGARTLSSSGSSFDVLDSASQDLFLSFRLVYGRPTQDLVGKPFSTFQLLAEIATTENRQVLQFLSANGNLAGTVRHQGEKATHVLALKMHYDYNFVPTTDTAFNSVVYEYGAQSFTGGLHSTFRLSPRWALLTTASLRAVALGAVRSDNYVITGEGRNYDFGPGLGAVFQATLARPGKFLVTLGYNGTWIHTVNGTDFDHYLDQGVVDARYFFSRRVGLGASYSYFHRDSRATDGATAPGPNTNLTVPIARLFLSTAIPRWGDDVTAAR